MPSAKEIDDMLMTAMWSKRVRDLTQSEFLVLYFDAHRQRRLRREVVDRFIERTMVEAAPASAEEEEVNL